MDASIAFGQVGIVFNTHHPRIHSDTTASGKRAAMSSLSVALSAPAVQGDAGARACCYSSIAPRNALTEPGNCPYARSEKERRGIAALSCVSRSSSCSFNGKGMMHLRAPDATKHAGIARRSRRVTAATLRTGIKEEPIISLETQLEAEKTFESVDPSWAFNEEPDFNEQPNNRNAVRDNISASGGAVSSSGADLVSDTRVKNSIDPADGTYNVDASKADIVLEAAVAETATFLHQGKSSLGTRGGSKDEFQVPGPLSASSEAESIALDEAVAETAALLQQNGSSLRQGPGYGGEETRSAVRETAWTLRNGQGSFVGKKISNAQNRSKFWKGLQDTGFGKVLARDSRMVAEWMQSAVKRTVMAKILANDMEFVKKIVKGPGSSFSEKVKEVVALRIIEDETAVPLAPSPWLQPYYPELRGFELLAADLKTLEKYGNHIQGLVRTFQVPLQNDYDPDQVAAYFRCRPHVVFARLVEVVAAFGSVAMQSTIQKAALKRKNGQISEEETILLTLRTAESLKKALLGLGTTFIKVAQSLSARPDIIGTETAKVLAKLQDRLPPFPTTEAIAIIEEELGCNIKEAFLYLSAEPVAAASFGQVYRACLRDGEEVAVKVQRPGLLFDVARDVYILRIGMGVLKKVAKLTNNYTQVADELALGLYGELDYRQEASNGAEFAAAHKHLPWVHVPKTLPHMTGRKVLVMEWLNGDRPFDLQSVAQGKAYSDGTFPSVEQQQEAKCRLLNMVNKGTEAALVQLLETGVMHADPHPGNILLNSDGIMQLIDFGLICHIERKHQGAMLAAIAHLVNGEWQSLTDDLGDMDVLKPTIDRFAVRLFSISPQGLAVVTMRVSFLALLFRQPSQALERAFGEGPDALIKNGVPDFNFGQITKKFFKVAYKFRFRLPAYYTLVLRSLASLEGFGLAVNPNFKVFGAAYPYVVRRILLDYTPTTQRVLRSLLLNDKREFKWDRISSLMAISSKSAADRAVLENVTVPNGSPEAILSGRIGRPQTVGNLAGLLLSRQGVGIRRVIYDADTRALALVFASRRATSLRRKVADRLGEALFIMFSERTIDKSMLRSSITSDATTSSSLPLLTEENFLRNRRLKFLLKAMVGRLKMHPILMARVGWTIFTVAFLAMALACHRYAVLLSDIYLDKIQDVEARPNQGVGGSQPAATPL